MEENKHLMSELDMLVRKQQELVDFACKAIKTTRQMPKPHNKEQGSGTRREIPRGVLTQLWKQDPSVERIGVRKLYLPHNVSAGPKDDLIEVVLGFSEKDKDDKAGAVAEPNADGDFLVDFEKDPFTFDLIHTYSVVRCVVDMYVRDLKIDWKWAWDQRPGALSDGKAKTPLRVICHAGEKPNATYHRGKKALKFYYYTDGEDKTTYLCRSLDIVAHEAGHAVLDALKPALYSVHTGQAGALHEAFGDLTAMFVVLEQLDMCEDIVAETKSDLREARYLTAIGEQFASVMSGNSMMRTEEEGDEESGDQMGMRNINNDLKGSCCPNEVHSLANVFTGFVFDFLVEVFKWEREPAKLSDAETLHRTSRVVRRILLLALYNTSARPDFQELAKAMISAVDVIAADDPADVPMYKKFLLHLCDQRELSAAGQ
eukprot:PhM_4_TR11613/c1_g1_i1/m.9895